MLTNSYNQIISQNQNQKAQNELNDDGPATEGPFVELPELYKTGILSRNDSFKGALDEANLSSNLNEEFGEPRDQSTSFRSFGDDQEQPEGEDEGARIEVACPDIVLDTSSTEPGDEFCMVPASPSLLK